MNMTVENLQEEICKKKFTPVIFKENLQMKIYNTIN